MFTLRGGKLTFHCIALHEFARKPPFIAGLLTNAFEERKKKMKRVRKALVQIESLNDLYSVIIFQTMENGKTRFGV